MSVDVDWINMAPCTADGQVVMNAEITVTTQVLKAAGLVIAFWDTAPYRPAFHSCVLFPSLG